MRKELAKFVLDENLSPFSSGKSTIRAGKSSIFMTKDARKIHSKVLEKLSSKFVFSETSNFWNCFKTDADYDTIKKRQDFFTKLRESPSRLQDVLKKLKKPRASWKPKYDVVVVTEDESSFIRLNKLGCGVVLIANRNDVSDLERYDIVQVVNCENFQNVLERLPQSVFLDSVEDAYLERFLEELSGWRENFAILNGADVSEEIRESLDALIDSFVLLENKEGQIITEGEVERVLEDINDEVNDKIKEMTISGEGLIKMLGEGKMPEDLLKIVRDEIEKSGIGEHIFNLGIPVTIDYKELEAQIRIQSVNEFSDVAERIKRSSGKLKSIPDVLKKLKAEILVEDFCNGIGEWMKSDSGVENKKFPNAGRELFMEDCYNIFLKSPQPISFILDSETACSILTGANSGGKTTLLEHLLQNISLFRIGLPISGEFRSPVFDEVYYFAKTKGSTSKGAFETLLTQMSNIAKGKIEDKKVLILADEIEAVTEPGVAGKIIGATAEYFIKKKCFVVLATHLGAEIAKALPEQARIDGIEAKGLDENFNLIVNHNPVLGKLASSTPELIIERMANSFGGDYFEYLFGKIKGNI